MSQAPDSVTMDEEMATHVKPGATVTIRWIDKDSQERASAELVIGHRLPTDEPGKAKFALLPRTASGEGAS